MNEPTFFPVIDGLRESASHTPDAIAILGNAPVTYKELHASACCIAARVQAEGIAPGARLAIWLRKGNHAVSAIWGALEAGLAYVPLDPGQPGERAMRILQEAQPEVLVITPDLLSHLPGALPDSVKLVLLSGAGTCDNNPQLPVPADWISDLPPTKHLPFDATPDAIAAVLFTSGSTGTPKGVQMSCRNLATFIGWAIEELGLGQDDVFANHASFHFDLSTFDLFAAAHVGASVWLVPTPDQSNIIAIADGLKKHAVTTIYAVPSILTMLTRAGQLSPEMLPSLRRVLFAGEVFPIQSLRKLITQVSDKCDLYNFYGPTETNVCTYYKVRQEDVYRDTSVPIGQPLPGQTALVIDPKTDQPIANGIKGELVIEGSLVTPGYLNPPNDRIRKAHASGRHPTGDVVSREDDVLVYHGRTDRIVKIQGNRVELGEIEAALLHHKQVRQSVVVPLQSPRGAELVAFVACDTDENKPGALDLLNELREYLPRYMLPKHVKIMPALPRTSNGKTDFVHLKRIAEDSLIHPDLSPREGVPL
ncbi:amino acid adenylation domain-containing protein [Pseudovibrio sp. WM33]|uniref:amino acid adenylation domain-containing protein n=1 Tax=Pseudovibrio sp. WM33 TaxID=1735585 RepID=UPI0007AE984C|nr:amino acid adenylation domain-containing protein [Pseudovibrio sp. WM33]KZL24637.1 D-alanine--poly(phosphoribitol) ligase subunit 1 [Pseudovibrio sp. WM33]